MQIIEKRLKDIKPYSNNPRHNSKAVNAVKDSIIKFGFKVPIVIDKNNTIVCGHTRYRASKDIGLETVPCIIADDLSPEQINAFRLVDNRTSEFADWNFDKLAEELSEIDTIDLSSFGFDDLMAGLSDSFLTNNTQSDIVEDDYNEDTESDLDIKYGDLFRLGRHYLLCGDATNKDDIQKLLQGNSIDMIYTDPPYGMNLDTDYSVMKTTKKFAQEKNVKGGRKYSPGIVDSFNPTMIDVILSLDAKEVFLWGADYYSEYIKNKNDGSWIVWDKRANNTDDIQKDYSSDKIYGSCFELCWSKVKHKRDIARVKWVGVFGTEQEFDHKRSHPTQKPVKLAQWFLERYSKPQDNILDLFGGSGSTLLACEQLDRSCFILELDAHYCSVILNRYKNFTGNEVEKIGEL